MTQPSRSSDPVGTALDQRSLVVVGASAGGIEALSVLVSTLPEDFPAPIVLAQHLDPRHLSHLGEILARHSRLPVRTVTDRALLEPGIIYVIPADCNVEVSDHTLRLFVDGAGMRPKPSINLLFSSAAQAFGERLVAVILTGTGSDGASGAYEVKANGGFVVIENPKTAAYPGLPSSLAPTTVDFVADLARIGPLLTELLTGSPRLATAEANALPNESPMQRPESAVGVTAPGTPRSADLHGATPDAAPDAAPDASRGAAIDVTEAVDEQALQHVLDHVRMQSTIDFSQYKMPTILRQLQRRMFATRIPDLATYSRYLDTHPEEFRELVSSFLIKVTQFFRDAELYAALQERVLPELIAAARGRENVLRIWSAGCATGEEAYSLAILVAEALADEADQFNVQIFATDADERAIEFARYGTYPGAALAKVSPARLARHFIQLDGNYQVTKSLRGLVIFGIHDLGMRAPFPHIDLVVCRNVLMYFTKDLQTRALQLFAYSLRDGGYLALGNAETTGELAGYFTQVSPDLRLYRRQGDRIIAPVPTLETIQNWVSKGRWRPMLPSYAPSARANLPPAIASGPGSLLAGPSASGARSSVERLGQILLSLEIGVVVVDRHYDIQIINSSAMRLLGIFTPAIGEDLIHLAQRVPGQTLRTAIDAAFRGSHKASPPATSPAVAVTQAPDVSQRGTAPSAAAQPAQEHATAGDVAGQEEVITVETVLGEQRSLQFRCYPYKPSSRSNEETIMAGEPGSHFELATPTGTAETTGLPAAGSRASSRESEVSLVLILISDITLVQHEREQVAHTAAQAYQESLASHSRKQSELEAIARRIQSENGRLKAEIERQISINGTLLDGNEKLAQANVTLRTANEALQQSEEEAEASTEEVKTLNEELQAANEELVTVNEELEATVEELHAANDELQARARELLEMSASLAKGKAGPNDTV